jgi:hypothetical protein
VEAWCARKDGVSREMRFTTAEGILPHIVHMHAGKEGKRMEGLTAGILC